MRWLAFALLIAGCSKSEAARTTAGSASAAAPTQPYASDTLPVNALDRVNAICDRLVKAGVAKDCVYAQEPPPSKMRSPIAHTATFAPVGGFPKDKCSVRVDLNDKDFSGFMETVKLMEIPADDFPRAFVTSTAAATWHATTSCAAGVEKGDKWDTCREQKPVATCAKALSAEYARYRSLHDAAARIVDGR